MQLIESTPLATYMGSFANTAAPNNTLVFSEEAIEEDGLAKDLTSRGGGLCFKVCTPVCKSNTCNSEIEAVARAMNTTQESSMQVRTEPCTTFNVVGSTSKL